MRRRTTRSTRTDTLLPYTTLFRISIGPTSKQKVDETAEEISELSPVFAKFRAKNNSVKAPIDRESVDQIGLTSDDIALLQRNVNILGDAQPHEVHTIFRMRLV